ncbi:YcdB/YcdC domain-containing protein [Bacillus cereus group sp. BfR-BA-01309]|uniref:YcdB/YcdC domain-containing protein n=1 Tax=Bacillus cereus group sp. BfR-BA-01309 TaxID=2920286 RepID=UPI001F592F77|nr:YcdB/YcdC domain-containing protein [Bacillus cereus group sp. BfR-BA-01309]
MNQKDKERKEKLAHIIDIPDDYRLVVDDQEGVDDPYHLLWWEHKEDEERTIQITLNRHTGNLIEFSIDDGNYFSSDKEALEENKAREIANAFLKKYTKEGYEFYTYETVKDDRRGWKEVHYMQEVNGYLLPNTGCVVRVHPSGNVVHFRYNGQKAIENKPLWPSEIVEENVVLENLKARQDMRLVFVDLTFSSCKYESGEEGTGYHLVYEPEPSHAFIKASTGKDLFGPDHYKLPSSVAVEKPKKDSRQDDIFDLFDWDKESFTKVAETEDDYEIRMKFVPKEELQKQKEEKNPYLMNEVFKKHLPMLKYNNFVCIMIDKSTNGLTGFIKLTDDKEVKQILSREVCLQKALQFLEQVIPDVTQYLRLWEEREEAEDGIERFIFSVYVNGIPAECKQFMVNINTENGAVMHYSGESSNFIKELPTYETTPKVTKEKALEIYRGAMQVHLEWFLENDVEETNYELLYKQTTDENYNESFECSRRIRYIDAYTGEKIWSEY